MTTSCSSKVNCSNYSSQFTEAGHSWQTGDLMWKILLILFNAPVRESGLQLMKAGLLRMQQIVCIHIHVECAINHAERISMHVDVINQLPD